MLPYELYDSGREGLDLPTGRTILFIRLYPLRALFPTLPRRLIASFQSLHLQLPARLPRRGFASRSSPHGPGPYRGIKRGLPIAPERQVSPLAPFCRPRILPSTTQAARRPLCQSPRRHRLFPGFATNEQARHRLAPNQVRPPTDCGFTSGCSPLRLAATQLPSIAEPATGSGTDLHHAEASSRIHSFPGSQNRIIRPKDRDLVRRNAR